jgi:hypothetical protein
MLVRQERHIYDTLLFIAAYMCGPVNIVPVFIHFTCCISGRSPMNLTRLNCIFLDKFRNNYWRKCMAPDLAYGFAGTIGCFWAMTMMSNLAIWSASRVGL